MSIFKTVWQFTSPAGARWSEIFYRTADSLATAAQFPQPIIDARRGFLDDNNSLVKIRVSDIAAPRTTTLVNINQKGNDLSTLGPAVGGIAAVVLLASTVVPARRYWWIRGFGQSAIKSDATTNIITLGDTWVTAVNAFIGLIAAAKFTVLPRARVGTNQVISVNVKSVAPGPLAGQAVVTTDAPPLVVQGQMILFSNLDKKLLPGLNGAFTVLATGSNTVTVAYVVPNAQTINTTQGKAKRLLYLDGAIIDPKASGYSYVATRATKNSSTGSRGARRAVRIRLLA